jgi:hypothetical protein
MLVEFYANKENQEEFCSAIMKKESIRIAMKTRSSNFAKVYTDDGMDYVDTINLNNKYETENFDAYMKKINLRDEVLNFIEGNL